METSELLTIIREYQEMILPFTRPHLENKRVLDIGCGSGLAAFVIQQQVGCTFSLTDVADLRKGPGKALPFTISSVEQLPYGNGSFDALYMQFLLHHIEPTIDGLAVLNEAYRVASSSLVIVEETISDKTDVAKALAFDERVNAELHDGVEMKVHHYYTHPQLLSLIEKSPWNLQEHKLIDAGNNENGYLETRMYFLTKD